ncbi:hypothetical protein V5799_012202 [Amblyomma americanum]|uniref:BZIP domain-containing protein n=1 Tax=Amblyomma americanum TaxID=6943 RepID=A0AAQ4EEP3_AMBAM
MEVASTDCQGKPKSHREHSTEPDYRVQLRNIAVSSNEDFNERPSSRMGWYDGFEDPYYGAGPDSRRSNEFDEDDVDRIYRSARNRSSSKRRRYKRKEGVATAKQKKRSALQRSSDHKSGSRRLKKVASGWTELFSTISEQPTVEEFEQDRCSFLTRLNVFTTSTVTLATCDAADSSSSVTTLQPPATAAASSSKEVLALRPPKSTLEGGALPEGFRFITTGQASRRKRVEPELLRQTASRTSELSWCR